MTWDVEGTDEFKEWFLRLTDAEDRAVSEAIDALIETGPALGRPFVDTLSGSRIPNLKELRPKRNDIRIARLSCSSAAARRVIGRGGMSETSQKRNDAMTSISRN